tara:strand:- start:4412 stop:4684 length:273 start_codon:yes stop_codon:yes gene_type:complete
MGYEIRIEGSEDGWEDLAKRLGEVRSLGGLPAMQEELDRQPTLILEILYHISLNASVLTGIEEEDLVIAVELAALIQPLLVERKEQDEQG